MKKLLLATCFTALTIGTGLPSGNNIPVGATQDAATIAAEFGKYIPEYQELKNQLLTSGLSEEQAENVSRNVLFSRHPEFRQLFDQVKSLLGQTVKTKRSGLLVRCGKGTWNLLKRHKGLIFTTAALVSLYYLAHLINDHTSDATGKLAENVLSQGIGSLNWTEPAAPCTLAQQPANSTTILEPVMQFNAQQAAQNIKALGVVAVRETLKGINIASSFISSNWNTTVGLAQQTEAYKWAANTAVPTVKAYATTAYKTAYNAAQPYLKSGCEYIAGTLKQATRYIFPVTYEESRSAFPAYWSWGSCR